MEKKEIGAGDTGNPLGDKGVMEMKETRVWFSRIDVLKFKLKREINKTLCGYKLKEQEALLAVQEGEGN